VSGASVSDVISQTVRSGVRLWREGDRLRLRSPDGERLVAARTRLAEVKAAVLAALDPGVQYFPLSSAQERLWFVDHLADGHADAYNMPLALSFDGRVDLGRLRDAVAALVDRHEALRTRVEVVAGAPLGVARAAGAGVDLVEGDLSDLDQAVEAAARRPFDLGRDPPFRATLFRPRGRGDLLLVVVHHIAADGWSVRLLFKELAQLYARQDPAALPAITPFGDLVCAEKTTAAQARQQMGITQGARWLDGYPGQLALPRDRPHPADPSFRGARRDVALSPEASEALVALAAQAGATPFVGLLAALGLWCHRVSGQDRLLIGAAMAGRRDPAAAAVIGPFANILPLPCDFRGDPTFREALRRTRQAVHAAMEFEDLPFQALVERLEHRGPPGAPPLVQVTIGADLEPASETVLDGLTAQRIELTQRTSKFDFSMEARLEGERLVLGFAYALDVFDEATAVRMTESLASLTEAAVRAPELSAARLPESTHLAACRAAVQRTASAQEPDPVPTSIAPSWKIVPSSSEHEPLTAVETLIAEAMEVILGVKGIGRDDNFFAVGGNSLRAVQLVELLRETAGVEVALKAVLLGRTVAELAIGARLTDARPPAAHGAKTIEGLTDAELDRMLDDLQSHFSEAG
jgi:hypothetical protein